MKPLKDEYPEEYKKAMKETRGCPCVEWLFEVDTGMSRDCAWAHVQMIRGESYTRKLRQRLEDAKREVKRKQKRGKQFCRQRK